MISSLTMSEKVALRATHHLDTFLIWYIDIKFCPNKTPTPSLILSYEAKSRSNSWAFKLDRFQNFKKNPAFLCSVLCVLSCGTKISCWAGSRFPCIDAIWLWISTCVHSDLEKFLKFMNFYLRSQNEICTLRMQKVVLEHK